MMKKKLGFTKGMSCILMVAILLATGCAKKDFSTEMDSSMEYGAAPMEPGMDSSTINYNDEKVSESKDIQENPNLAKRKIIQNKYISMETTEFDDLNKKLESFAFEYMGYIESSEVSGKRINDSSTYASRHARYTFRIPAENFNTFISALKGLGNIVNDNNVISDVTSQYFDLDARIETLKVQEKRLLELLEGGKELTDILEIETKLANVRYEIETYTSSFKNLENQISYATLNLDLQEVIQVTEFKEPAKTVWDKMSQGFMNSLRNIKDIFVNLVIVFIAGLPYFIVLGLFIWAIVFFVNRNSKKTKKMFDMKKAAEDKEQR